MMSYKGKSTTRSWASLPAELLQLVVTHLILDVSAAAPVPHSWSRREDWPNRMVFTLVRDAAAVETVMRVVPAWAAALEYHLFWEQAAATLDPRDHTLSLARQYRLTPYRHYRQNLYLSTCLPCRVNQPNSALGLLASKKRIVTLSLGAVPVCKDHRKERFCGVCLRDVSSDDNCIAENEERAIWRDVVATCKLCRAEKLYQVAADGQKQRGGGYWTYELEAIGGRTFSPQDWEARQAVDAFVEMGEGTVAEVITLCMEKLWLRTNTKIVELMRLAVATSRMQSRLAENAQAMGLSGGGFGELMESEEELSDLEEDEDDDPELLSITEDSQGLRESAINNWARTRILDGNWFSPADQWFLLHNHGQVNPRVYQPILLDPSVSPFPYCRAEHPVLWSIPPEEAEELHPNPELAAVFPPPSFNLCSAAYDAFRRELSSILLPAMANIVRKVVMECAVDGADATVRVSRMSVEDIAGALREGDTWFNGLDWIGRRQSAASAQEGKSAKEDRDDSSSSSKSGSRTTSPVLSTTTLDTTPSPPPSEEVKIKSEETTPTRTRDMPPPIIVPSSRPAQRPPTSPAVTLPIAISPVLPSPTQIPSIPFIPVSMAEMPRHTIETFKAIWREACAPLFHCRCRICERAILKANIDAGMVVPSQHAYAPQIRLSAAVEEDLRIVEPQQKLVVLDDEDVLPISDDASSELEDETQIPMVPLRRIAMGRKRSNGDVDDDNESLVAVDLLGNELDRRSQSPPKRQKIESRDYPLVRTPSSRGADIDEEEERSVEEDPVEGEDSETEQERLAILMSRQHPSDSDVEDLELRVQEAKADALQTENLWRTVTSADKRSLSAVRIQKRRSEELETQMQAQAQGFVDADCRDPPPSSVATPKRARLSALPDLGLGRESEAPGAAAMEMSEGLGRVEVRSGGGGEGEAREE